MILPTFLLSFSILTTRTIASPCQQKRDASLDLFSLETPEDTSPWGEETLPLAFETNSDAEILSLGNNNAADPGVSSIFSSSTVDGTVFPAAVDDDDDDFIQAIDLDSATNFASFDGSGGTQEVEAPLFLPTTIDSEGLSGGENLVVAQLPDFGGITDFSFKDLENEGSCLKDQPPTTQSEDKKMRLPGTTEEINLQIKITPDDAERCPKVLGRQLIALCCFNTDSSKPLQVPCSRRTYYLLFIQFHL